MLPILKNYSRMPLPCGCAVSPMGERLKGPLVFTWEHTRKRHKTTTETHWMTSKWHKASTTRHGMTTWRCITTTWRHRATAINTPVWFQRRFVTLGVLCETRGSLWRVCAVVPVVAGFVTGIYVPFEFPPDLLQRDPAWGWRAEHSYSKRQLDQVNSDFAIGEVLVLDQFHDLDPTSDLHCLCTITFVHAVKLLLVFYALYELTFVALAHSSGVFVRPRLAVGPAEISTGHAES